MKIKCSRCSEEHDISKMEPSFALPDCIAAMSPQERTDQGAIISKDICSIRKERGFVRVLLPIPVQGEGSCNWGVWVEIITYAAFMEIVDAWNDLELLNIRRPARLANELHTYSKSLGLPGIVSFPDMKSIGRFDLLHEIGNHRVHELISDQRGDGVPVARKLEWLLLALHPSPATGLRDPV